MRPIRSIIVFNSATAGDFLLALCWSQLLCTTQLIRQEESGRMSVRNEYFKSTTAEIFHNPGQHAELDMQRTFLVENTHYWLDMYTRIADRCVFIDYPAHIQDYVMEVYLEKVYDNDKHRMLEAILPNQNPIIAKKLNTANIEQALNIHWQKNIRAWRQNPDMSAIQLCDFFDLAKTREIVKKLIDQDLMDMDVFDKIYDNWYQKNNKLRSLF
jgi:hypothetical protein